MLSKPQSQRLAATDCSFLGEFLLEPSSVEDFEETLRYLTFAHGVAITDKYWITGKTGAECHAMDLTGKAYNVDCQEKLPGLCSQRALMASGLDDARDERFHLRVPTGGNTSVVGYRDKRSFRFLGIRYAPNPKRWTHSTFYEGEENEPALFNKSLCVQGVPGGDEDCLFLNVWTPFLPLDPSSKQKLRPVIFYIHGGAFESGSGSLAYYDGGNMASRGDVVVVSHNYRLGTLGFLSFHDGSGNYGLADTINALHWIRRKIRFFGGDPDNITIVGESAGAAAVSALLASPKTRGNFSAAIMHSKLGGFGTAKPYSQYMNLTTAFETYTKPILLELGCLDPDPMDCMRRIPAQQIGSMPNQHRFLVQDDDYLPFQEPEFTGPHAIAQVPILMGTTAEEAAQAVFLPVFDNLTMVLSGYGLDLPSIQRIYDSQAFPRLSGDPLASEFAQTVRILTDNMWRCSSQAFAAAAARHQAVSNLWFFEFDRTLSPLFPGFAQCTPQVDATHPFGNPSVPYYRCHGGDMIFFFGNQGFLNIPDRDGLDIRFSQYVVDAWAQFAWNHDPNPNLEYLDARGYTNTTLTVKKMQEWPAVGNTTDTLILRELNAELDDVPFKEMRQCEVLDFPIDYYESTRE